MKKTVLFLSILCMIIASLSLTGCNKNEPEQPANVQKYHVRIEAGKVENQQMNGPRRALGLEGNTLTASWAAGELVSVRNLTKNADLEGYLAAESDGIQTVLSGDLAGTINAGDVLELKFLSPNYTNQGGTIDYIASHCDYAVANIHVASVTWGSITFDEGVAVFENRQAIVKLTLMNEAKDAALSASQLVVEVDGVSYTITPPSATSEIFVALPGFSDKTIKLTATVGSETYTYTSPSAKSFEDGKYYIITVGMAVKNEVHPFSISPTKQIEFAHGNLQYNGSTGVWRIAENQYDFVGDSVVYGSIWSGWVGNVYIGDEKCSNTQPNNGEIINNHGWIDLLGWNTANEPLKWNVDNQEFIGTPFVDWGVNEIYDPRADITYPANTWRTLSMDEWHYLFCGRTNAGDLFTTASIDGLPHGNVKGVILLPDDFVLPTELALKTANDLSFNFIVPAVGLSYYKYNNPFIDVNDESVDVAIEANNGFMYNENRYTVSQWAQLEAAGAVFLPAAGRRDVYHGLATYVQFSLLNAHYWSCTLLSGDTEPIVMLISYDDSQTVDAHSSQPARTGCSIRLVRDL